MSGETEANISGWTVDTLHTHLRALLYEKDLRDQQRYAAQQERLQDSLKAQEQSVNAALRAAEAAVLKAEAASEKRFESINEFRGQLSDQASTFMPRSETTVLLKGMEERLAKTEERLNQGGGRAAGIEDARAIVFALVGLFVAIAAVVIAVVR